MSDVTVETILAYLREHSAHYPPEQLRQQLLASGYQQADIDAAFARLQATAQPAAAAPLQPNEREQLARALAYVEQNRGRYNDAALRAALLQSGYPPALVDEVMRRFSTTPQPGERAMAWPLGLLVMILNFIAMSIALVAEMNNTRFIGIFIGVGAVLVIGELIAGLVLRRGSRERLGRVLLFGALFTIGFVLLFGAGVALLFAMCMPLLGGF